MVIKWYDSNLSFMTVCPHHDFIALNVDGSAVCNPGATGFGGCLRNHQGNWILGFFGHCGESDILHGELLGILRGLNVAWDEGYRKVICYSDSKHALSLIEKPPGPCHKYATIIASVVDILQRDWIISLRHTLREGNACADFLAKLGSHGSQVLVVSYTFMENAPAVMLMNYLTDSWDNRNLQKAAAITNLHDYLSDYFEAIVEQISEAYTGCFTMITFCTAVSTMGLMLLWISAASTSEFDMVYIAIFLLALGKAGQTLLRDFLQDQLDEKVRAKKESKPEHGNTDDNKKQDHDDGICNNIWRFPAWFAGIILTVVISYVANGMEYNMYIFRFGALLMGGTYLIFYFGCACQSHNSYENLPAPSTPGMIFRICKAVFRKWKLRSAKVEEQCSDSDPDPDPDLSPQGQEMEGELCTAEEVRAVKSLVPLMCLGFTFFAYSMVVATGNTFFLEQTSNLKPAFTNTDDTPLLFAAMSIVSKMSVFICWLISIAFGMLRKSAAINSFRFKSITATIIRIGIGMVCAIICCIIARKVELHRLSLIKEEGILDTKAVVPQFLFLGIAVGLVEGGLKNLFRGLTSESMWTFENSFTLIVIGTGKLFTIPAVLIFSHWFKETVNTSHLDRYYLMLVILNSMSLLAFVFASFRYACKQEYPKNEEIEMEQILVHARQEDPEETNAAEENSGTWKRSMVAIGHPYRRIKTSKF